MAYIQHSFPVSRFKFINTYFNGILYNFYKKSWRVTESGQTRVDETYKFNYVDMKKNQNNRSHSLHRCLFVLITNYLCGEFIHNNQWSAIYKNYFTTKPRTTRSTAAPSVKTRLTMYLLERETSRAFPSNIQPSSSNKFAY